MQNRSNIKEFILQIEQDFPVNDWNINGTHLWPILRIRLFFYLINKIENKQNFKAQKNAIASISLFYKIKRKLKNYTNILYYFLWRIKLPQKKYMFVGADAHRVNYRECRFNRYFDVMIEKNHFKSQSMYFEYGSDLNNQYNKPLIYKFNNALNGFISYKKSIKIKTKNFNGYDNFLEIVRKNPLLLEFAENNSELNLLDGYRKKFGVKLLFFDKVLKKIQPAQVAVLCYYSEDLFALIASANKLGIETIDMQHGPQTDIHLSYGSWSCIPEEGYDVLPRTFWCWDAYSKEVLDKWIANNKWYTSKIIGNPWVDYWKAKKSNYKHKDFILYSLQPNPITLEQTFTPQIIQSIKSCTYKWFIRLHPRQLNQLSVIKQLLQEKDVLHLVNIEDATTDPLPELLANAKVHITHSSGSALEADFFGLKTVLINEIGLTSFPHLIDNNAAYFIDYRDDSFTLQFNTLISHV